MTDSATRRVNEKALTGRTETRSVIAGRLWQNRYGDWVIGNPHTYLTGISFHWLRDELGRNFKKHKGKKIRITIEVLDNE